MEDPAAPIDNFRGRGGRVQTLRQKNPLMPGTFFRPPVFAQSAPEWKLRSPERKPAASEYSGR